VTCVTANENCIISGSLDGTIRIWNGNKCKVVKDHGNAQVNCLSTILSTTGYFFSCDNQGRIKLFSSDGSCQNNIETNQDIYTVSLIYRQDTLKSVTIGSDGRFTVWQQLPSLEFTKEYETIAREFCDVPTIRTHMSPDHSLLFVYGVPDGTIPLYDFEEHRGTLYQILLTTEAPTDIHDIKYTDRINSLDTNTESYYFVYGRGKYALFYGLETKTYLATIVRENDICNAVRWLNGSILILGYESGTVVLHHVLKENAEN
jgi:WD40 repeat protein